MIYDAKEETSGRLMMVDSSFRDVWRGALTLCFGVPWRKVFRRYTLFMLS